MDINETLRNCPSCGRGIKSDALRCQYCFARVIPVAATVDPPARDAATSSPLADSVARRYRDAYAVAKSLDAQGQALKTFGLIVAGGILLVAMVIALAIGGSKYSIALIFGGVVVAAGVFSSYQTRGIRLAADGQQLLASLDVAVHTSPFMTSAEKAQAMALS